MVAGDTPIIVEATSGKSKCKTCRRFGTGDPTIAMGSLRVGHPGHAAGGVTVYHWLHPACFAQHCINVDRAPTNKAKCRADGSAIDKGELRLLLGKKDRCYTIFKLDNANRTIVPRLVSLVDRASLAIHGLDELSLDERTKAEQAIFGGGTRAAARTASPVSEPTAVPRKRARSTESKKAPASKKRGSRQLQDEDEDCELVD